MKFKLKIGSKEYEIEILETEEGAKIKVDGKEFYFKEENLKPKTFLPKKEFGEKKILSPVAGEISEIFVKEGEEVEEGKKLLVILAMKMENEILSPGSGKIKKILVKKGEIVKKDQLLLVLE
jgi:Acetyl/propionyl-CoA carboxylase, alpha subunit